MHRFFIWREEEEEGTHSPYHLFWPPVTQTMCIRCQNPICELVREAKRGADGLKQRRGKSSAIWERDRETGRQEEVEVDKEAVEAERKVEVNECEIWHSPLTQLLWERAVQQISNMLMGKCLSTLYLPKPLTQPRKTLSHSVTTSGLTSCILSFTPPSLCHQIQKHLHIIVQNWEHSTWWPTAAIFTNVSMYCWSCF